MKFKYIVVYENNSDRFNILLIKVKVTAEVQTVFLFTAIQIDRSYNSTLVQGRKLKLRIYVHLILIYKLYEYRHAWMILHIPREC